MKRSKLSQCIAVARADAPSAAQLAEIAGAPLPAADAALRRANVARAARLHGPHALIKPAVFAISLAALSGAVVLWIPHAEPAPLAHTAPPAAARPALEPPRAATPTPAETTEEIPVPKPKPQRKPRSAAAPPEAKPTPEAAVPARPAIEREAELVEAARSALHADPTRALTLAQEHARDFPQGVLVVERDAIRIHALALLGRAPEARARLAELARTHPTSIHVTRLQRALGDVRD